MDDSFPPADILLHPPSFWQSISFCTPVPGSVENHPTGVYRAALLSVKLRQAINWMYITQHTGL